MGQRGKPRRRRSRVHPSSKAPLFLREPYDWPESEALDRVADCLRQVSRLRQEAHTAAAEWTRDEECRAWGDAERIIRALVQAETAKRRGERLYKLDEARRQFVGAARDAHVVLDVRRDSKGALTPLVTPIGARARILALIWKHVFHDEAWKRLRECVRCAEWFVDHSDSHTRRFCSGCRHRWWDRERRREAGQKSQKPLSRARKRVLAHVSRFDP